MLDEALKGGTVAVIPGFQGVSDDGRLATLGRGGSDTSAVAIAAGFIVIAVWAYFQQTGRVRV